MSMFGEKLMDLAESTLDALHARALAKGATATADNDIDEWKEGINSLRALTWAELLTIADEKGYPKSWAEAFYRRSHEDEKKGAGASAVLNPVAP
ncbi:Hypothetical protein A7982_03356 [Minicystis rosea]|nr:Hypothetical protein A7982_03356 [Minicystis rosea]